MLNINPKCFVLFLVFVQHKKIVDSSEHGSDDERVWEVEDVLRNEVGGVHQNPELVATGKFRGDHGRFGYR